MKVAVCLFGLCHSDTVSLCVDTLKSNFGDHDFFYGTWKNHSASVKNLEELIPGEPYMSREEPVMHYHPFADVDTSNMGERKKVIDKLMSKTQHRYEKLKHATKQILGHAYMLSRIPSDYDMIVRARFDVLLSERVDFTPLLKNSYDEQKAIGFGSVVGGGFGVKPPFHFDRLSNVTKKVPKHFMLDFMIMHPRSLFNIAEVQSLHEQKQLLGSEHGWAQTLSPEYNHEVYVGGVQLYRLWHKHHILKNPHAGKTYGSPAR